MIRNNPNQTEFIDFIHPFGGRLPASNRWVKLSHLIPWESVEKNYAKSLKKTNTGAPALSGRIAFGALIIKERLRCTDEETLAQIQENPFLQYFLGLHQYKEEPLFDPSMMVHFRKRFGQKALDEINSNIIDDALSHQSAPNKKDDNQEPLPTHKRNLLRSFLFPTLSLVLILATRKTDQILV